MAMVSRSLGRLVSRSSGRAARWLKFGPSISGRGVSPFQDSGAGLARRFSLLIFTGLGLLNSAHWGCSNQNLCPLDPKVRICKVMNLGGKHKGGCPWLLTSVCHHSASISILNRISNRAVELLCGLAPFLRGRPRGFFLGSCGWAASSGWLPLLGELSFFCENKSFESRFELGVSLRAGVPALNLL